MPLVTACLKYQIRCISLLKPPPTFCVQLKAFQKHLPFLVTYPKMGDTLKFEKKSQKCVYHSFALALPMLPGDPPS